MLDRFLVVGAGGSGGRTVRYLRAELKRRLEAAGYMDGLPAGWGFVHVDIPTQTDIGDAGPDPDLQYIGLAAGGVTYRQIDSLVVNKSEDTKANVTGWRPDPRFVQVDPSIGAGQMRGVGRMVAAAYITKLVDGLTTAMSAVESANPTKLTEAAEALGEGGTHGAKTWIFVVSSLGGGSGAGMYLDLCDVLRMLSAAAGHKIVGVTFAPDIFADVKGAGGKGIMPNALAALSEILASSWNYEAPHASEFALLNVPGLLVPQGKTSRGADVSFLVSRTNGEITLPEQRDVYKLTGAALAAIMLSSAVQDEFSATVAGNWGTSGLRDDSTGLTQGEVQPLSSFGYASLSLGRRRFALYSKRRLAAELVLRLLNGHRPSDDANIENDAAVRLEVATNGLDAFLGRCDLQEKGLDDNDILNSLRNGEITMWNNKLQAEVDAVLSTVTAGRLTIDKDIAQAALTHTIASRGLTFGEEQKRRIEGIARDWVESVQHKIIAATAESLVSIGGYGTVTLLELVNRYLIDEVAPELFTQAGQWEQQAANNGTDLVGFALRDAPKKLQCNGPELRGTATHAIKPWKNAGEAHLSQLSATLIRDLAEYCIAPLRLALIGALDSLQEETEGTYSKPSPVKGWASGQVSSDLLSPQYELLLEDPVTWPETYERLIKAETGKEDSDPAIRAALMAVVRTSSFVGTPNPWSPSARILTTEMGQAKARFTIDLRLDVLLARSHAWLDGPTASVHKYTEQGLGEWLQSPGDSVAEKHRASLFLGNVQHALTKSRPLIELDKGALSRVHGDDTIATDYLRILTAFPLSPAHPIAGDLRRVLGDAGISAPDIDRAFQPSSKQDTVGILTFLGGPVSPAVINSIAEPLAADAAALGDTTGYWFGRRSRPLVDAIPAPPAFRRALLKGWFVARLLGLVDLTQIEAPAIWSAGGWITFGKLLGTKPALQTDVLGAILESFPLAIMRSVHADEVALAPYRTLADFGSVRSGVRSFNRHQTGIPGVLSDWIDRGTLPAGNLYIVFSEPRTLETADERRAWLAEQLDGLSASYRAIAETPPSQIENEIRSWDLAGPIEDALAELRSAVTTTKIARPAL